MATSSDTSEPNGVKSRRPAESAFKQQRLPAWQPILTAGTVLPTFFVIGIAFIPVGIGLLYFSDEVKEYVKDYTFCVNKDVTMNITCADYIKQYEDPCFCELTFNLTEDFKADVYFYYGLSNYYQNHRRYVKSRDDNQLLGRLGQDPSTDCDPFAWGMENGVKKPIAPCGAIANSLFNDSLTLYSLDLGRDVPVNRTGIAWSSDKNIKFRNPDGDLRTAFANYTKPSNWRKNVWELDLEKPENNGFQNEDLIVWMRTAALPTFRKLYRRVDHEHEGFRKGLSKGTYRLTIQYNYPVTDFDGRKSFIISTTSLLGGKNPFLGVAYVVVGTLCLLLGIVLLIIHVRCSKRYYPNPTDSMILDVDAMNTAPERSKGRSVTKYSKDDTKPTTVEPNIYIVPAPDPTPKPDLNGSNPKTLATSTAKYGPDENKSDPTKLATSTAKYKPDENKSNLTKLATSTAKYEPNENKSDPTKLATSTAKYKPDENKSNLTKLATSTAKYEPEENKSNPTKLATNTAKFEPDENKSNPTKLATSTAKYEPDENKSNPTKLATSTTKYEPDENKSNVTKLATSMAKYEPDENKSNLTKLATSTAKYEPDENKSNPTKLATSTDKYEPEENKSNPTKLATSTAKYEPDENKSNPTKLATSTDKYEPEENKSNPTKLATSTVKYEPDENKSNPTKLATSKAKYEPKESKSYPTKLATSTAKYKLKERKSNPTKLATSTSKYEPDENNIILKTALELRNTERGWTEYVQAFKVMERAWSVRRNSPTPGPSVELKDNSTVNGPSANLNKKPGQYKMRLDEKKPENNELNINRHEKDESNKDEA